MDYSPELDPEIHGFLREQQSHHRNGLMAQESRGSVATHCELRLILDGLEKLGFQLVTTASYTHKNRSHNEFIMHRDLSPSLLHEVNDHHHHVAVRHNQHKLMSPTHIAPLDGKSNKHPVHSSAQQYRPHQHSRPVNRSDSSNSSENLRKHLSSPAIKEPYKVKNYSQQPGVASNSTSFLYY